MSHPSAQQNSRAIDSADLWSVLSDLLLRLGEKTVILLRPLSADFDSRRDDVDLLLNDIQRTELLAAAFEQAAAGHIHLRVRQVNAEKIQLILWNLECTSRLTVDLWSAFSQLPGRRGKTIRADWFLSIAASDDFRDRRLPMSSERSLPGTIRLPADIDFCLLVLHLVSKKKRLTSSVVRERLLLAFVRLRELTLSRTDSLTCHDDLARLLQAAETLPDNACIPPHLVKNAEEYLLKRINAFGGDLYGPALAARRNRRVLTVFRRWLMQRVPCLAVVGSDGSGKSTVCRCLAGSDSPGMTRLAAKKLYRRSLLYQLVSGTVKRVTGTDRGKFDDRAALWITLRASAALWLRFAMRHTAAMLRFRSLSAKSHRNALILDRSVAGFLIRDRKMETPRLHRAAPILERFVPPVTTVVLTVPFIQLTDRKLEMSRFGHQRYQRLLFHQALRQQPSDIIVISNTRSADDAAESIRRIHCESDVSAAASRTEQEAAA